MDAVVDGALLAFLAIVGIAIVRQRSLFAVVMLSGIFSLLMASTFVLLDAVDVAFTEAAVGAGISTVLMLGTLALTASREKIPVRTSVVPLAVVVATGALLLYGVSDLPAFGDPQAPINTHVVPRYLAESEDFHIPNVVTNVLASYRGFDTLGEVTVIFTAGVGVMLLLSRGALQRLHASARGVGNPSPQNPPSPGEPAPQRAPKSTTRAGRRENET